MKYEEIKNKDLFEIIKEAEPETVIIVLDGNGKYCFADTKEALIYSAEADYAYENALREGYEVLGTHVKGKMVKVYVKEK